MDHWVWVVPLAATCRGIVYPIQNNQGHASSHHHYATDEEQQGLQETENSSGQMLESHVTMLSYLTKYKLLRDQIIT